MKSYSPTLTIDLRRLRVLRELRLRGTIAATADALHLTPSAISQQIAGLSRDLGVPLLLPHGRRVRLTPQAAVLLEHAAAIDAELERARARLAAFDEGIAGEVAIGAFGTAITGLVVPALRRLRACHPAVRLTVQEIEAPTCFTRLDAGELDVVVTIDHLDGPSRNEPRYVRTDLLEDPLLAALPETHPLAGRPAVDLRDLADEGWIVGAMRGPCQEVGLTACIAAGFSPAIRHRVNDWGAALALVAAGCGVALIPWMAAAGGPSGGVSLRPLAGPQRPSRHIYAAVRAGADANPLLAPVLAALEDAVPEPPRAED
jgi:DNA-binding transcriptional LysR family regulator